VVVDMGPLAGGAAVEPAEDVILLLAKRGPSLETAWDDDAVDRDPKRGSGPAPA
jgi:hypothetical protein